MAWNRFIFICIEIEIWAFFLMKFQIYLHCSKWWSSHVCTALSTHSLPLREIFSVLAPPGLHRRRPLPPSPPPLKGNQFTWETLHSTHYYHSSPVPHLEPSQHLPNASRATNFRANTTNQSRNRSSYIWIRNRVLKNNFSIGTYWRPDLIMPMPSKVSLIL